MRIVIVGPGAIGCLYAAFLSKQAEVWLLDKNEHRAKAITQTGIKLEGISGKWQAKVKATADPKDIQEADLIVICVKSYDTKAAIKNAKSLMGEKTMALTLQNGVGNVEIIGEVVGHDKVIGGVSNHGATLLGPGYIRHAGKGETVIGRIDGKTPVQLRKIREVFNKAKLEMKISRDIKALIWSKLIINVGINALASITRLNNGRLTEYEGTRQILRSAVTEAIKVAKRKRIKLIYDDPLAKVEAVCEATAGNVCSMLQDIRKEKKTEIDFINGVIIRQAQSLGIPVPVNSALTDLIKTIESTYKIRVK